MNYEETGSSVTFSCLILYSKFNYFCLSVEILFEGRKREHKKKTEDLDSDMKHGYTIHYNNVAQLAF